MTDLFDGAVAAATMCLVYATIFRSVLWMLAFLILFVVILRIGLVLRHG